DKLGKGSGYLAAAYLQPLSASKYEPFDCFSD
ncbi:hypothetical protein A2U01_0053889, partial [Trifolium medium]|nr:hypothetical protein [Trifolium medium]